MAKIDKTGDAAIMPLHKILMKMCGQTGYTPDAVFEGLLDYIISIHTAHFGEGAFSQPLRQGYHGTGQHLKRAKAAMNNNYHLNEK